ncbi:MAG TPA: tripartite tricarboxylate transporter substrate-binding protein [Xanthobacteraceae bacterium]|nr:tripartite tricarboxylate transporter substrate-binding protein [Xanthobacteraceae bacterium]
MVTPANAQTWPDRPIRLIVPSAPGGPTDIPARLLAQILPKLGQPAVVENRPGAGGAIGARAVATAAPDGTTLLIGNTSVLAVIPAVSASAGYDPAKSFAPVAKISESYQVLVVSPATPWTSVREFVSDAKANPGKFNLAHTGAGGLPHLTAELFKASTGVELVGVPYKSGGEAVTALIGGQVHCTFEAISILLPLIRDGKVRALGLTGRSRTPLAPDIPTMIEAGVPDYEVTTFYGVVAPAGTPAEIVAKLNAAINEGFAADDMRTAMTKLGSSLALGTADEFGRFMAAQGAKWSALAKAANIKVD